MASPSSSASASASASASMPSMCDFLNRLHASGNKSKIVVLDVDETIGYFVELGIFCDALTRIAWNNDPRTQYAHFNQLMDAFPEFLRPNILELLKFLKMKKNAQECAGVLVYTNNCGPRAWVEHITRYIESKLGEPLFDQIVAAFKVNGEIIEVGRTTNDKTYEDLLRCTKLPPNVEMCFLDDQMHSQMEHAKVYYINVKPYVHQLSVNTLIDRFMKNPALRSTTAVNASDFRTRVMSFMQRFVCTPKNELEQEVDAIITKKIMEHLKTFFLKKMKGIKKTNASLKMKLKTTTKNKTLKHPSNKLNS
jgi:hypothetical protein